LLALCFGLPFEVPIFGVPNMVSCSFFFVDFYKLAPGSGLLEPFNGNQRAGQKTIESPHVLRNVCKCIYLRQSGEGETFGKVK